MVSSILSAIENSCKESSAQTPAPKANPFCRFCLVSFKAWYNRLGYRFGRVESPFALAACSVVEMTVTEAILERLEGMPEHQRQEVLDFIARLGGDEGSRGTPGNDESAAPLASLIGSCKGMFASPEEADEFLSRERDAWHS